MKTISFLLLSLSLLIGTNSCVVMVGPKHDNGNHNGWYKNPNNPHNPEHQDAKKGNNGNGNGNGNGNAKGNGNGKSKGK